MKKNIYLFLLLLSAWACGGQHNKPADGEQQPTDSQTTVCASVEGEWLLEHVVVNDTLEVRPADVDPESKLYVHFYNDSTFNFQTGCNAIGGRYIQAGDSITISDLIWTEMACEDMRVEELLRSVLPQVNSFDRNNDSVMRLKTPASAYIVLKQSEANVKCVKPQN